MDKILEIKQLIKKLNMASESYYNNNIEIMSNYQYDELYDRLLDLEKETNTIFSNSPTQKVGYALSESLSKEVHQSPMLSLDKTKSVDDLKSWLGDKKGVLSWKLDGLTVILTYDGGVLTKAVTRGNGQIGEVVTNNVKTFKNIPLKIAFDGKLTIRGEAFITYSDFEKINNSIEDVESKYKNPRNLCSGSLRQLNSEITAQRNLKFQAFSIVDIENLKETITFDNSFENQLKWLVRQGFEVVEYEIVDSKNIDESIKKFNSKIIDFDIPSDGLVLTFDDIEYGNSLGVTSKFPKNAIAFKWQDEIRQTILKEILWSPSRTGLVNPIALFEPVELEGTIVSRASLHNVSILKELNLSAGDTITVYKANMIIPQVNENLTKLGEVKLPEKCPACNFKLKLQENREVEVLICENLNCIAKKIKGLSLFVSRDAMNIENLSEATLEKFIEKGFIKNLVDIYKLERFENDIVEMEGFGEKSYKNLIYAINKSRNCNIENFLYALGIEGIGLSTSKLISIYFGYNFYSIRTAKEDELLNIDGIGNIIAKSFVNYFNCEDNIIILEQLLKELTFNEKEIEENEKLKGVNIVITGNVEYYKNRNELKNILESLGAKVSGSVSSKTTYLINNDINSSSSKNKKAKELGIPIITEEEIKNIIEE